jgi:hypothetical protein
MPPTARAYFGGSETSPAPVAGGQVFKEFDGGYLHAGKRAIGEAYRKIKIARADYGMDGLLPDRFRNLAPGACGQQTRRVSHNSISGSRRVPWKRGDHRRCEPASPRIASRALNAGSTPMLRGAGHRLKTCATIALGGRSFWMPGRKYMESVGCLTLGIGQGRPFPLREAA